MYLEHWGLKEMPFENTPDPKFFYSSKMHTEALGRILYAITNNKGCALLTGEYGCGKTALVRKVIESLDSDHCELGLINSPIFAFHEFLREILFQYGQDVQNGTKLEHFHRISGFCFENAKNGKQNILVIDEAQLIEEPQIFEHLRLLLNLQLEDKPLMNVFLVGQPELRDRIMVYPQLDQRVGVRYNLHYFSLEDTVCYIRHRLKVAGATRDIFSPDAFGAIFKMTRGIPRCINNTCDLSLLDGSASGVEMIDECIVKNVH